MLRKRMPLEGDISSIDNLFIHTKYFIRRIAGSPARWFGLETSNLIIEYVPLFLPRRDDTQKLERVLWVRDEKARRASDPGDSADQ
jgi:KUP system potassium uptake protein